MLVYYIIFQKAMCVFDSVFVKLILDRIDFVRIYLVRNDFEVKWFMFGNSSKGDFDRK